MAIIDGFKSTLGEIVDGRVDVDSPIDESLMTALRDQIEFIQRWLGKSFIAGAVADHRHDDIDSKKILASDIVGSLASSTAVQFSTTTGLVGFTVNIPHGLGRTPNTVWGMVTLDPGNSVREFRFHRTSSASEVEGKAWDDKFGNFNEHPLRHLDLNDEFNQNSLTGDEIANDLDTDLVSSSAPTRTWRITVDDIKIILTCAAPLSNTARKFYFMLL